MFQFNFDSLDPAWPPILRKALEKVDPDFLAHLKQHTNWLPGETKLWNAFQLPLAKVNYILLGESPYPRPGSANGFAFWDAAVGALWSQTGLSTEVNRATSLRNFIKLLLIADRHLSFSDCSQATIAALDKGMLISTADALFNNLLHEGFLLLNASLTLSQGSKTKEARYWAPLIESVLIDILKTRPHTTLILWGKIAKKIHQFEIAQKYKTCLSEHPYNLSFISNPDMLRFFSKFNLLRRRS